jgi:hypothetical protein
MKFSSDSQRKAVMANLNRFSVDLFAKRKLYHGTSGLRGYAISKEGLIPPVEKGKSFGGGGQFSDPECVYLTGDKEVAKSFAMAMEEKFGGKPYVFEMEADPMQEGEFYIDLEFPDSWKHKGVIPKERLREVKFSKREKQFLMPDNIENPHDYVPVKVNVQKFKEYWERNPDNYYEKESVALEDRYEGVAKEVAKSDKIYMPEVYAKPGPESSLDTIDVADGRHRSAAFIEHDIKEMKIVVPVFQKKWFEERMGV